MPEPACRALLPAPNWPQEALPEYTQRLQLVMQAFSNGEALSSTLEGEPVRQGKGGGAHLSGRRLARCAA